MLHVPCFKFGSGFVQTLSRYAVACTLRDTLMLSVFISYCEGNSDEACKEEQGFTWERLVWLRTGESEVTKRLHRECQGSLSPSLHLGQGWMKGSSFEALVIKKWSESCITMATVRWTMPGGLIHRVELWFTFKDRLGLLIRRASSRLGVPTWSCPLTSQPGTSMRTLWWEETRDPSSYYWLCTF